MLMLMYFYADLVISEQVNYGEAFKGPFTLSVEGQVCKPPRIDCFSFSHQTKTNHNNRGLSVKVIYRAEAIMLKTQGLLVLLHSRFIKCCKKFSKINMF